MGHATFERMTEQGAAETHEPEQAVLTWPELFAQELPKRNGRRKRPQPALLSLFQLAVNVKEERVSLSAG